MSKLLNTYNNLKKQNPDIIYLFKNGVFYLALEDDAKFLSNEFNLKLVNHTYLQNKKIKNLLCEIKDIDVNNLSVSNAFAFIEKINIISKEILGGTDEF